MDLSHCCDFSPDSPHLRHRPGGRVGLLDLVSTGSSCVRNLFFSPAGPVDVLSPDNNLSKNKNNLADLSSQCETLKRKKARLVKIPSFASNASSDSGVGLDSPDPDDMELTFERALQKTSEACAVSPHSPHSCNKMPIGRINSLPVQLMRLSPTLKRKDPDPQRCGIFGRARALSIADKENVQSDSNVPVRLASLLTAPLVTDEPAEDPGSPVIHCRPHGLFRSPSMPNPQAWSQLKRVAPPNENTPVRVKRRRILADTYIPMMHEVRPFQTVQRSKPLCLTEIEQMLDSESNNVSGDFTKPFALPTVEGKHQDLKYITPEMMVAALKGCFDHLMESLLGGTLSSRLPHSQGMLLFQGALNLHQEDQIEDFLLKAPIGPTCHGKRVVVVFHCEFSSERGPRMCRYVRERDRTLNEYPNLYYPELYILKGGYKEFFPLHQDACESQDYRPMRHETFKEDLRKFHRKSRTWAGECSKRDLYSRIKKISENNVFSDPPTPSIYLTSSSLHVLCMT
ncbi:M-phase inducer phosphatase 1-like [Denticeps clupeoides]|uniref:M-phase inducer phosphatase 1-like n=1 Tax=Denticeps clupeoides TaxID=299321 RepID=UPI0010A30525|nr:M-phase inducer phosphatase 1-like [Denticeps clupeoides]